MRKSVTVLATLIAAAFLLGACGETGKALQDAANLDPQALQGAGEGLREAGKMCSENSVKVSPLIMQLRKNVEDQDLVAAQATATQMRAAAQPMIDSEAKANEAAEGLASLPNGAGQQSQEGIARGFRECAKVGEELVQLASTVDGYTEEDVDWKQIDKDIDAVNNDSKGIGEDLPV